MNTGIVQLSEAASIALHTMTVLARTRDGHLTVHELAERMPVSEHHLAKVLQRLVKAGLATSVRGPRGGFSLRGDPREITLLQVYEALEGRLSVPDCVFPDSQGCGACILDDALRAASELVRERLASTSLHDLSRRFRAPPAPLVKLGGGRRKARA